MLHSVNALAFISGHCVKVANINLNTEITKKKSSELKGMGFTPSINPGNMHGKAARVGGLKKSSELKGMGFTPSINPGNMYGKAAKVGGLKKMGVSVVAEIYIFWFLVGKRSYMTGSFLEGINI